MIAALPMYDRPETAAATDRYWGLIRDGLRAREIDAPDDLTRTDDLWTLWQSPDLVLAQTCGLPFRAHLHAQVQLVGTPDFGLPGCAPGYYNSVIIARASDGAVPLTTLMAGRVAINEGLSQSGWAAFHDFAQSIGMTPARPLISGGHRNSARMVAEGRADIAALDAQTWGLILRHDAWSERLTERSCTRKTPALPYITARGRDAEAIANAVEEAIAALAPEDRQVLGLVGLARIPASDYLAQPLPPDPADMPQNPVTPADDHG